MGKHLAHRFFDAPQAIGYGACTLAAGAVTTVFATATLGLAMTGIGIPLAFLTGVATVGTASVTTYTGSKTIHKTSHVLGGTSDCHSLSHAKEVLSLGGKLF